VYLKLIGAAKTRSQAARMVDNHRARLVGYGGNLKNSNEVFPGERYEVDKATGMDVFEVLAVPPGNSLSKKDRPLYVKHTQTL
jgi:ribosomal 50S subunit-recycling heat shock protein